jgi:hypothetical protein
MGYVMRWHDQYAIVDAEDTTFDNLSWTNDAKKASRFSSTVALDVKEAIVDMTGIEPVHFVVEDRT